MTALAWYRRLALVAVAVLVASACGGASTPAPTAAPATQPPATAAATPVPATPAPTPAATAAATPAATPVPATPAATPVSTEPVALTMWVTADTVQKPGIEKIFLEYKATHPNVSLAVEEFPFLDLHDKLTTALLAGTGAPDMAWVEISRFGSLLKGDIGLVDLTDRIAASGAQLIQARQNNYTYKGRAYAVEGGAVPVELYYRDDIFKAAGITTPFATWDDYIAAGQKLKKDTGKDMIAVETSDYDVWTPLMLQFGGGFFDTDGKVIMDNAANGKAFNFLVDLVRKQKIAIPAPGGDQYNPTFWGAYEKGDIATIWGADWMASILKGFVPKLTGKWRAQPLPTSADAPWVTSTCGGTGTVITKQAKNVDAAWDFLQYVTLNRPPDKPVGGVPNNQKWWTDPAFQVPDPYFGDQKIGQLWLDQAKILLQPGAPYLNPDPNNPTAYDIFTRTALGPAVNGDVSADDGLKAAAAELRSTVGQ